MLYRIIVIFLVSQVFYIVSSDQEKSKKKSSSKITFVKNRRNEEPFCIPKKDFKKVDYGRLLEQFHDEKSKLKNNPFH